MSKHAKKKEVGAETLRTKKEKQSIGDAVKCSTLTELLVTEG